MRTDEEKTLDILDAIEKLGNQASIQNVRREAHLHAGEAAVLMKKLEDEKKVWCDIAHGFVWKLGDK